MRFIAPRIRARLDNPLVSDTVVGVIAIPMFYFVIQSSSEKLGKPAPVRDQPASATGS